MRLRGELQRTSTIDDLLEREAIEHDQDYEGKTGFGSPTLKITKEYVCRVNDHVFKKNAYIRGMTKRRMLESLGLSTLADNEGP